ncbi:MAG: DNA primase large subunit PriL [Nitrososphaerota archaeon]
MSEELLSSSLLYYAKYPFLPKAREFVKNFNLSLDKLSLPPYNNILERAIKRIKMAYYFGFVDEKLENLEIEILSYPVVLYLASVVNNPFLSKRISLAEAERIANFLINEDDKIIEFIGKNIFNLDIFAEKNIIGNFIYDFSINVYHYIDFSSKMNAVSWKLTNRILHQGRVFLFKREVVRILKSHIENHILSKINEFKGTSPPPSLNDIVNEIKNLLKEHTPLESFTQIKPNIKNFPPCIKNIYEKISLSESVSHFARFTLVSFLINLGVEIEKIITLFSQLGDFDEKMTKYQVEHIAGMRGGKKKYIVPSCKTLKTHNLCIENGKYCENIKSPLKFYFKQIRRKGKSDLFISQ